MDVRSTSSDLGDGIPAYGLVARRSCVGVAVVPSVTFRVLLAFVEGGKPHNRTLAAEFLRFAVLERRPLGLRDHAQGNPTYSTTTSRNSQIKP